MGKRYPYTHNPTMMDGPRCETCGNRTKQIVTVTEVSWFRGDDEVETKIICPVCYGWKTTCKYCGKLLANHTGLKNHLKDKHGIIEEEA